MVSDLTCGNMHGPVPTEVWPNTNCIYGMKVPKNTIYSVKQPSNTKIPTSAPINNIFFLFLQRLYILHVYCSYMG